MQFTPLDFEETNRRAWDVRAERNLPYVDTAKEEDFANPLQTADPVGWLRDGVVDQKILCLAAGGGRHSVLFAAAGARVTVVDQSERMLNLDRKIAAERGLYVRVVRASMLNLDALAEEEFEVVFQPVSGCYVPELISLYRQVARVLASNGLYISFHKQPACLQARWRRDKNAPPGYALDEPYYRTGPLPPANPNDHHREHGTLEFLHPLENMIGGLCRQGFVIEDLVEPPHGKRDAQPGTFAHRALFAPPFLGIKARRADRSKGSDEETGTPRLWTPGGGKDRQECRKGRKTLGE